MNWSIAPECVVSLVSFENLFNIICRVSTRTLSTQHSSSSSTNTVQTRVQPKTTSRQLPPLPTQQLPKTNQPNISAAYFNLQDKKHMMTKQFLHTSELFYYQTSSSSNATDSLPSENSDNENNK